jgi:hypothetical protein
VGYRVTVVADETRPVAKAPPRMARIRVKRKARPYLFWGPVVIGALSIAALMIVLIGAYLSQPDPEVREAPIIRTVDLVGGHGFLARPDPVDDPVGDLGHDPPAPMAPVPPMVAVPMPGGPIPGGPHAAKDDCAVCRVGGDCAVPADRETFGTSVAFARNPVEAAKLAGDARKLLFVLHVSGNFEEARFT